MHERASRLSADAQVVGERTLVRSLRLQRPSTGKHIFPESSVARQRLDRQHLRIMFGLEEPFSQLLRLSLTHPPIADYEEVVRKAEEAPLPDR